MKPSSPPLPVLCKWLGAIPANGESVDCHACGRTCDARAVRLCRVKGAMPIEPEQIPAGAGPSGGGCCGQTTAAPVKRPGYFKRIKTVLTAAAKFIGDGLQTRSPEEHAANLTICDTCPLLVADGMCDGCGCLVAAKVTMRQEECPAGKWFADLHPVRPLVHPVRNLIYHLLPVAATENWRWNLDQLAQRWGVFNGRKYLSIVDCNSGTINDIHSFGNGRNVTTVHPSEVVEYCDLLGLDWTETRVVANSPRLGEVVSFPWLLGASMNDRENETTMYAHGKGTTHSEAGEKGEIIRRWGAAMYRYCLDDIASVDRALERYPVAASLIRTDPMSKNGWHPSGTFFWMRHAALMAVPWQAIQQTYHGVEAYIGDHFQRHEVAVLAHGNSGDLYKQSEWDKLARASEIWDAARSSVFSSQSSVISPEQS